MPTLACHVADAPASHLVTGMLTAVPDRGAQLHLARAGKCVLGLAADERLPGEGSICEDRGWAAVVVGTLDAPAARMIAVDTRLPVSRLFDSQAALRRLKDAPTRAPRPVSAVTFRVRPTVRSTLPGTRLQ